MENKKNTLRLEYLPLKEALELYKQGVFVKGVFPSNFSKKDFENINQSLQDEFLEYYCPNLATGLFEYDISIEDYEPQLGSVQIYDDVYGIKEIFSDELGYNIETEENSIINYDSRLVYKDREIYENKKQEILAKSKDMVKNVSFGYSVPFTSYVTINAKTVPKISKILQDGLYHFTSEKVANAILKSGCIKVSGKITTYIMKKKTFFFGETPELQDVLYNCKYLQNHIIAIYLKYNDALRRDIVNSKVKVRLDDGSVCILGDTKTEYGYEMTKVKMVLVKHGKYNRFYYKKITDDEFTIQEMEFSKELDEILKKYLKMPRTLREIAIYSKDTREKVLRLVRKLTKKQKVLPETLEQSLEDTVQYSGENNIKI